MKQSAKYKSPLHHQTMLAYGAGDLGLNFYWQGTSFFLLFYYTDVIGLPNTAAGIIFVFGGFVDAISDPALGVIADRTKTKWGQYRPYLLFGIVPLGLSFIFMFSVFWHMPMGWLFLTVIIGHISFRLCYTIVSIPYSALGTRLTFNAQDRTKLAGIRMMFGALGGMIIVLVASGFRSVFQDSIAFALFSITAAIAGSIFILITFFNTRENSVTKKTPHTSNINNYNLRTLLPYIIKNKPFVLVVGSLFLLTLANMIIIKTVLYRFEHILSAPIAGGVAIGLMTGIPLIAIPCWVGLYVKLDKRPAFLAGCLMVICSLILLYFSGTEQVTLSIIAYTLIAAGFSAFAVGFWSILPDTIDYGHWISGTRIESGLVGLASAFQKVGIALAGLFVGIALDIFNYTPHNDQLENTLIALHNFSILSPLVLMIGTAILFYQYPISHQRHTSLIEDLAKRETNSEKKGERP